MNLATLPWELLEAELRRVLVLEKNPLACAVDWHEVGKPMAAFLHSAELLNLAHQISDRESVSILAGLGIDVPYLLQRLQPLLPETRFRATEITDALAVGTLDLAVSADRWAWWGVLGVDPQVASSGDLPTIRQKGQALLRWIATLDEAPPLTVVLEKLKDQGGSGLILRWATQTFALFPGYCTRRQVPTLGRPAMAYALRKRSLPVRPVDQPQPSSSAMTASLVDDITAVVAEIALQAVRHRQDWEWRVADTKRVSARLHGDQEPIESGESARLALAMYVCHLLALLGRHEMETLASDEGRAWLRRSGGERQHQLLGRLKRHLDQKPDVTQNDDYPVTYMLNRVTRCPMSTADYFHLWCHLATAWRELGAEVWLRSAAMAWWQRHPPLGSRHRAEGVWAGQVASALDGLAIPLGIVASAGEGEHRTIRLTPAGRWALGLEATWTPPAATSLAKPVIVQADHTIIFLAPDASLEVAIGTFTDRLPGAHGTGALFKLSKTACRRAAVAGLDAAHVVQVLAQASAKPLPANVVREVEGWFGRLRRAVALPALLITTSDQETATNLVALLGATRLGPQAVSLPPSTRPGDLERRLAKEGILLDTTAISRWR